MNAKVNSRSHTATLLEKKSNAARTKTCAVVPVRREWRTTYTCAAASRKKPISNFRARVPIKAPSAKCVSAKVISAMEER